MHFRRQTKTKSLTYPKVETKPLDAIISDNTSQESIQKDTIVSVKCAPENTSDETEASRSVENQMISLGCFNMEEEREITKKTGNGSAIEEESNMSAEEEKERKLTGGIDFVFDDYFFYTKAKSDFRFLMFRF